MSAGRELGLPLPADFMRCADKKPHTAHWHKITVRLSQRTGQPHETVDKFCDGKKAKRRRRGMLGEEDDIVT